MKPLSPNRYWLSVAACLLLVGAVLIASPGIGSRSGDVGWLDAWQAFFQSPADRSMDAQVAYQIGFRLRLPGTLLALQAGITLALCGAVFQTLFRNPLATPYTLGIASGGSLGALIAIKLGICCSIWGMSSISIAAFIGALAVVLVVFSLTRGIGRLTTNELLLAGVTMGLFCSAMMMLVTYLSDQRQTFAIVRWMMGSLTTIGHDETTHHWPVLVPCWIVMLACAKSLNQYRLGDEMAAARGVNVAVLQLVCVLCASVATAAVVASCGPIGFVGLVVPHITSLLVGRDCRILLPVSALLGGVFLAACDWLAQIAMPLIGALSGRDLGSTILPVGVVTAVVGVPVFLVLLHRRTARDALA